MFSKILIANRGEIAVRIIRACREMGISTVAVFSEADKDALFVSLAEESYCIGSAKPTDSYLNMQSILTAAEISGAEAIHPGYGFLSENHLFAALCASQGIAFIGPPAEVIKTMGNKNNAKTLMQKAGVPVIPGCRHLSSVEHAKQEAERLGYPVLIKASAGGGGRGIRKISSPSEMENAFLSAQSEAKSSFGNDSIYMEKLLENVKHIEVQILADSYGNVVAFPERECSIQRRHQKLLEESPCVVIDEHTRQNLIETSIIAARAANYKNIGTIEYLYDTKEKKFYFMEMNTRLQVEHGVTEMSTSYDIVKWQIRLAAGAKLGFSQKDIKILGHSIECRINAENSRTNLPSCGKVSLLHIPGGPMVRFDSGLYQGYEIPPFYDSMIGKLIVSATTREEAIRKMHAALAELVIVGIEHNGSLFEDILSHDLFISGNYLTSFLENN